MANLLKLLLISLILVISSSCAGVFERRTFIDEMERESDGFFRPGQDFQILSGDNGEAYRSREEILKRTPASRREYEQMKWEESVKDELSMKERSLSRVEYMKYRNFDEYFENDSDRIYYLSLSPDERDVYLRNKGMGASSGTVGHAHTLVSHYRPEKEAGILEYVRPNHLERGIQIGMSKTQVEQLWGRPVNIEVAGDPRYENERWSFYHQGKMNYVYFESGEVQGWSLE